MVLTLEEPGRRDSSPLKLPNPIHGTRGHMFLPPMYTFNEFLAVSMEL